MFEEKRCNHVESHSLISVVIPAYQAVNTIKRAVDSALSIPLDSVEVIVVDDGSTDGTAEVLAGISASDVRLRVVRQENSGRSVARNNGFNLASGKWVMFLDADDYLLPEAFCSLIERAENSTADLVFFGMKKSDGLDQFGNCTSWDSGDRDACSLEPVFVCAEDVAAAMIEDERYSFVMDRWKYESNSSCSRLYRREQVLSLVIEKEFGFKPFPAGVKFSEDRLFNIALLKAMGHKPVEFDPVPLYFWDLDESGTCARVRADDVRSLFSFLAKVSDMKSGGLLLDLEADQISSREVFVHFQRAIRGASIVGAAPKADLLAVLTDSHIRRAMMSLPKDCIGSSRVWGFAAHLIAHGYPGLAYDICSFLARAKFAINLK